MQPRSTGSVLRPVAGTPGAHNLGATGRAIHVSVVTPSANGNLPPTTLALGSPTDVRDHCDVILQKPDSTWGPRPLRDWTAGLGRGITEGVAFLARSRPGDRGVFACRAAGSWANGILILTTRLRTFCSSSSLTGAPRGCSCRLLRWEARRLRRLRTVAPSQDPVRSRPNEGSVTSAIGCAVRIRVVIVAP